MVAKFAISNIQLQELWSIGKYASMEPETFGVLTDLHVVPCFRSSLATMVADGRDNRISRECTEPIFVTGYRTPVAP